MSTNVLVAIIGLVVVALLAFAILLNARRVRKIVLAISAVALLLTVGGFVAILMGDSEQQDYDDEQKWPTIEATVLEAEVLSAEEGKCDVHVIYTYTVDGTTYTDDDQTSREPQECSPAQDRVNTYDETSSVMVRYDPERPQHSFVESARATPGSFALNGGRILMAIGGLGTLGAAAWWLNKRHEQ